MGDAKARAKALIERTETEMDEERKKLQSDVEKQIADVSLAVAEKVIGRDISKADNRRLIEESLKE